MVFSFTGCMRVMSQVDESQAGFAVVQRKAHGLTLCASIIYPRLNEVSLC